MYRDIKERTFEFAVEIVSMSRKLYRERENTVLGGQVLRSGTSIGANIEEAVAAYSKDEYIYKMNVALKEARETHFWLRLLQRSGGPRWSHLDDLITECGEIKKILGSIVSKLRKSGKC